MQPKYDIDTILSNKNHSIMGPVTTIEISKIEGKIGVRVRYTVKANYTAYWLSEEDAVELVEYKTEELKNG